MVALYEKYRPRSLGDVKGVPSVLKKLDCIQRTTGLNGQVFWITGESGTGKTTLARVIANQVADPMATDEVDAQDVSMEALRDWETRCQYRPLFGQGYCVIINEAHGLSSKAVSRLQTLLEDENVQKNSTWIFTTTNVGERLLFDAKIDACPFLSRAIPLKLELNTDGVFELAECLQSIALTEKIDGGKDRKAFARLLTDCNFNMRLAIQKIASGEML